MKNFLGLAINFCDCVNKNFCKAIKISVGGRRRGKGIEKRGEKLAFSNFVKLRTKRYFWNFWKLNKNKNKNKNLNLSKYILANGLHKNVL